MRDINAHDAMIWMARLAATDGVVTPMERKVLCDFAKAYGQDAGWAIRMAYGFAKGVELPEVDLVSPSEMKGRLFEQFVVSLLGAGCRLLAWRSDKIAGDTYAAENLYPDLHIRHRLDGGCEAEYFVECKYRSSWGEAGIDLSGQIWRYRQQAAERGVALFVALGVGGSPSAPGELYMIPGGMGVLDEPMLPQALAGCQCEMTAAGYDRCLSRHLG